MSKEIEKEIRLPKTMPRTFDVQGIKYMDIQSSKNRIQNLVANFKVRPTDVFLLGYPKTGNHWLKFVVALISANGNLTRLNERSIDEQICWLEFGSGRMVDGRYETEHEAFERFDKWPHSDRRFFTSHLHWNLLPKNVKKGKIILLVRNPRDAAVSLYHFMRAQTVYFRYEDSFQQFADMFCDEDGPPFGCGSYFSFYVKYWEHLRDMPFLIVHYEDMKKNLFDEIGRIAQFLDIRLDDDVITKIADACTFQNMKTQHCISVLDNCMDTSKGSFLRKGEVGDWKSFMTPNEICRFDDVERVRLSSSKFRPKQS